MLGIGKFFSMNQARTERVLLRVNQMLKHSRLAGELLKAQDSEDFKERAEQFRHDLMDNGCSVNLMFERISAFQDLMQHHALLSGMHYFLYTANYLERIFKDKNAMADAESKDKLYKMIAEDSNFTLQARKVWKDRDFNEKLKVFEKALDDDGYKGIKLKDSQPFEKMLLAHAVKSGEIYFTVVTKHNFIEIAKRLVR